MCANDMRTDKARTDKLKYMSLGDSSSSATFFFSQDTKYIIEAHAYCE